MDTVFGKALWDQRHSLPGWAAGIATLVLLESALWPSISGMSGFDSYLDQFPAALKEMFAMDRMATGAGFLDAELFSLMLPMLFLVAAISLGARMIAGEEEAGTLDLLVVTPLTTSRLYLHCALALVVSMGSLAVATWVAVMTGDALFDLGVTPANVAGAAIAMWLLSCEFGLLTLTAGALTGRRGVAVAVGSGLALIAYLLYVGGLFLDELAAVAAASPFHQALRDGPLLSGPHASYVWMALVSAVVVSVAAPVWGSRDI